MIPNKEYKHRLSDSTYTCIDFIDDFATIVRNESGAIPFVIGKDAFPFYEPIEEDNEPEPDIGNSF